MFSFLKRRINGRKRIGYVLLSNEIMPIFSEVPTITNKTLHRVVKDGGNNTVIASKVRRHGVSTKEEILYQEGKVLTQDGVPIIAKDNKLKKLKCNNNFVKNGYKKGQIYSFSSMGYLGNLKDDKIVFAVTDSLVIFRYISSDNLSVYSYKELEELKIFNKLRLVS